MHDGRMRQMMQKHMLLTLCSILGLTLHVSMLANNETSTLVLITMTWRC